ncbi:MAG: heavy metal-responsive transcriptional regulator [Alphaproteobacteria bacterium]|nr:heavy metal-responsive transcriptional regulator [Alphaproteobacteria bacterium]|tara:strand:- start:575 stop:1021 length:447 start_codon:yes stop_codon:yes gene_type:complete
MTDKHYITIGKLSELSECPADTIRYYEKLGILKKPDRAANGYRVYSPDTLNILLFIRRGKIMNFTLDEIKQLLTMAENSSSVCGDILSMVEDKISKFKQQIADSKIALNSLERFAKDCPGGQVPAEHCPFVHYLNNKGGKCHENGKNK